MGILDRLAGTLDGLVSGDEGAAAASSDLEAELDLARGLAERGEATEGLERLSELARRFPRAPEVLETRGLLLETLGRREESAADLGRAVDLEPTRPSAWVKLGEVLAELSRLEPARDAFRRALATPALQPAQRRRALLGLGRVHGRMGQHTRALRELRQLVDLVPDTRDGLDASAEALAAFAAFGRALLRAGERDGAEWLARAARLPGGGIDLLLEAAEVEAAELGERAPGRAAEPDDAAGEADPAVRLLREATARAPDDARVRATLARRLGVLGELSAALREAEAATAAHPEEPAGWSALREIQARGGDFTAALAAAERERALGAPLAFEEELRLALGACDPAAIEAALRNGRESDPGYPEARAFHDGSADWAAAATLAHLAPRAAARRFVLRALAYAPVPRGSVLGLLAWARGFVIHRGADPTPGDLPVALLSLAVPLSRALDAFDRPLLVAVMGEFNAGKSSFVNALAGAIVARVGVTPTTATINVLRYGPASGGRVRFHDGGVRDLQPDQMGPYLAALDDDEIARIRLIEIFSPTESLRRVEIVDTPGLNALRTEHERVAREFLGEADAVVWVFALGQAAKASERVALDLVHAAGKRVLGVVNKIDGAEPGDVEAVLEHVRHELGDRLERLVPFSARLALRARLAGRDTTELESSGLVAVETALEELFYRHARQLKEATAITALQRFLRDTRPRLEAALAEALAAVDRTNRERSDLDTTEADLLSTLAGERIALRARIDRAMRAVAPDAREFGRPRPWPFGDPQFDSASESDLADLLDDAVAAAVATTEQAVRRTLSTSAIAVTAPSVRADLEEALATTVEAFGAYARGSLEGAAAVFFRVDAGRTRLELGAMANALARHAPDPDRRLFHALEQRLRSVFERARVALAATTFDVELKHLALDELISRPLAEFESALALLVGDSERIRAGRFV